MAAEPWLSPRRLEAGSVTFIADRAAELRFGTTWFGLPCA
jgi:hypothetical protein